MKSRLQKYPVLVAFSVNPYFGTRHIFKLHEKLECA